MREDGDVYEIPDADTFRNKVTNKPSKYSKVVVFFNAVWCPPCRMINSEFLELATVYKGRDIVFMEVNADKLKDVCHECNVDYLPTFLCYAHGDVVDTIVGPDKIRLTDAVSRLDSLQVEERQPHVDDIRPQHHRVTSIKRAFKKLMHFP